MKILIFKEMKYYSKNIGFYERLNLRYKSGEFTDQTIMPLLLAMKSDLQKLKSGESDKISQVAIFTTRKT